MNAKTIYEGPEQLWQQWNTGIHSWPKILYLSGTDTSAKAIALQIQQLILIKLHNSGFLDIVWLSTPDIIFDFSLFFNLF